MVTTTVLVDHDPDHVTHHALDAALEQRPEGARARWVGTEGGRGGYSTNNAQSSATDRKSAPSPA